MHQSSIRWPSTEVSMECQPRGQWSVNHDTWSTVDSRSVSIDSHPSIKHKLTVDWGVSGVLSEGWSGLLIGTQLKMPSVYMIWKIYANYSKKSRYQTTTMVISFVSTWWISSIQMRCRFQIKNVTWEGVHIRTGALNRSTDQKDDTEVGWRTKSNRYHGNLSLFYIIQPLTISSNSSN